MESANSLPFPFVIRSLKTKEVPFLADFLYEAIFQKPDDLLLPRSVIQVPEIQSYIQN